MKTLNLPEGYKIEELPGGCRQHFPGGYREYHRLRGGYVTHCVTDGRAVSHEDLNNIFNSHQPFQNSKFWDDGFPFRLRDRTDQLEKDLASWKTATKVFAACALLGSIVIAYKW